MDKLFVKFIWKQYNQSSQNFWNAKKGREILPDFKIYYYKIYYMCETVIMIDMQLIMVSGQPREKRKQNPHLNP
jgi:hypothetical protein